jgi:hypothetical protein
MFNGKPFSKYIANSHFEKGDTGKPNDFKGYAYGIINLIEQINPCNFVT